MARGVGRPCKSRAYGQRLSHRERPEALACRRKDAQACEAESIVIPLRPDMPGRRFKASGPNIKKKDRHTDVLQIRCAPELAAQARALCAARGVTLAQILKAGLDSLAVSPNKTPTE